MVGMITTSPVVTYADPHPVSLISHSSLAASIEINFSLCRCKSKAKSF